MLKRLLNLLSILCAILPVSVTASDDAFSKPIRCEIPGCIIMCQSDKRDWVVMDEEINFLIMQVHESGVVVFETNKGVKGKKTIVVGPGDFICKVEGQK